MRAVLVVAGVPWAGVVTATLAGVGRETAPAAAAATAANEARRLPVSRVTKLSAAGRAAAAGRCTGFGTLPFAAAARDWLLLRRFLEVPGQHLVDKCQRHPCVGRAVAVHTTPTGVGGQHLTRGDAVLSSQKVTSRDDLAVRERADPALKEAVEASQIQQKLGRRLRYQPVCTVGDVTAAGSVDEAKEGGDNVHLPVTADRQDPLDVGHSCRHGDFVGHDQLPHDMKLAIRQLNNLGDDAVAVCLAKGRIVEAVENNWSLSGQGEAVGLNLRQDSGDGGGVEYPPALRDGVGDDPHVGRRVGQPGGVAAADEEGRRIFCRLGKDGGKDQVSREDRFRVQL